MPAPNLIIGNDMCKVCNRIRHGVRFILALSIGGAFFAFFGGLFAILYLLTCDKDCKEISKDLGKIWLDWLTFKGEEC